MGCSGGCPVRVPAVRTGSREGSIARVCSCFARPGFHLLAIVAGAVEPTWSAAGRLDPHGAQGRTNYRGHGGSSVRPSRRLVLLAIVFISVLLRLLSAWLQGDAVAALPGIQDQISYDALA